MKSILKLAIKVILSGLVLGYVFSKLDPNQFLSLFKTVNPVLLLIPLTVLISSLSFMVLKWQIFLEKYDQVAFKDLIKIYWASDFIGLFSLGSLGSEAYKAISLKNKKVAILTSLSDKAYSFIWYAMLIVILYALTSVHGPSWWNVILGSLLLFASIFLFVHIQKRLFSIGLFSRLHILNITNTQVYKHAGYSLLYLIFSFFVYSSIFFFLNLPIDPRLFVLIPILTIALTLPISFQGLGVREFFLVKFAILTHISPEAALAASLLVYAVGLLYRLFGVIPFFLIKKNSLTQ